MYAFESSALLSMYETLKWLLIGLSEYYCSSKFHLVFRGIAI